MRVLFLGRYHRIRRRETILNPPSGVVFVPEQPLCEMGKDEGVKNGWGVSNFVNRKLLNGIDLIYSPGKVILNAFSWVVEVDNVACLAYYNLSALKLFKWVIGRRLKSKYCKAIICISEAAKNSVVNFFKDDKITSKCVVIYPYVKHYDKLAITYRWFNILFVGYNFYLKGGKELLEVFNEIKKPDWKLTMITNHVASFDQVLFINPDLCKETLYEFYRSSDVFVQPTFQDSFGMVNLEAISAGLPVIATDVFALPEIVENGKNGFLMQCPVSYFTKDFLPNPVWWDRDITEFAKNNSSDELRESLKIFLTALYEDKELREEMSQASLELANTKFSEEKRKALLKSVLEEVVK